MADRPGDVRLVDLDVIKRYSIAVRQEWAPADEVLAALEASAERVRAQAGAQKRTGPARKSVKKATKKRATPRKSRTT